MRSRKPHLAVWVWALGLPLLAGCHRSPQELLIGRWYNGEMSLRFNQDGTALYNSSRGKAPGRYQFEPSLVAAGAQSGTPNLIVEVVHPGGRERYQFEAVFLAHDRLRLHDLTPRPASRPSESVPQFALLRRAGENTPQR
jgi:hypothetical protein